MIKLYNTLGRKLEDFKPHAETVGMYTCGPTLYDWQHIGNLRTFVLTDLVQRIMKASNYTVKNVMNITDVEDKIIKALGDQSLADFTGRYFEALKHDMNQLNITEPQWVRATDKTSIDQMAKLIEKIMAGGLAYESDGSIYLSISKYSQKHVYGVLQSLDPKALRSTERIQADEYDKDSAQDFALWKAQKPGEPSWEIAVAGKTYVGRPGWHIECSAMSELELGQQFDIHLGGVDLLFPHHENEIAQSEAANNKLLAKYWLHGEMLMVEGQKMSKSLGNIIALKEVVEKGFDPLELRLLFLQAHYRKQLNFTWESLAAAAQNLKSLQAWADRRFQLKTDDLSDIKSQILSAVQNDLGTPQALAILNTVTEKDSAPSMEFLSLIDELLGLDLSRSSDISDAQKNLIQEREIARRAADWAKADELRDQLAKQNLEIKDTPSGPIWQRA